MSLIVGRGVRLDYEGATVGTLKLNSKRSHRKGPRRGNTDADFLTVNIGNELSVPNEGNIEIMVTNGLRITLNGNFNPEAGAQLVRGLSA